MLRRLELLELGSGMAYATRVIHPGLKRGSGKAQAARTMTGADRHGGASPVLVFRL
jgi:hypothetical protein